MGKDMFRVEIVGDGMEEVRSFTIKSGVLARS
jgi:hypothetical protein